MLRKFSLIDELRKGGFDASLITTFNAYLPFYEEVVLRGLENAGVRHNVLMMDARQYTASLLSHPPRLAGRRYTLAPMDVPGAFHPKLVVLLGKKKALVAIGSHNVTLAGFGFNRELTTVVTVEGTDDTDGRAVLSVIWREIQRWLSTAAGRLPAPVVEMIRRVGDYGSIPAGSDRQPDRLRVLAGAPGAEPLWNQLHQLIGGRAKRAAVTGAFFDAKLGFLRRVLEDLRPDRLLVGIDPRTVQIPESARKLPGVKFVCAGSLGVGTGDDDAEGAGYLHAKAMFIESDRGQTIFASGSANPSAPAWLATPGSGNVEVMLARLGEDATTAMEDTGFSSLFEMAGLDAGDWSAIAANVARARSDPRSDMRTGIAVVDGDRVRFDSRYIAGVQTPEFVLLGQEGVSVSRLDDVRIDEGSCVLSPPARVLNAAVGLQCVSGEDVMAHLVLHHARILEEQARTGVQRRFRDALLSLRTDSPNIGLLIECIDKIVFVDDETTQGGRTRKGAPGREEPTWDPAREETLSVDLDDVRHRKSRRRLDHSSDFTYLLDALIYHLRVQEDRIVEELDRFGRGEEEQVGADDDEDEEAPAAGSVTGNRQAELLELCHSKVRTVVNRMVTQLRKFSEGTRTLEQVVVRLLGVLAVLRELRGCDGRVPWIEKGQTAVPLVQRAKLFEEAMLTLFEPDPSLLHLKGQDDLADSDEMARLKGLLVWLAWDCGLTLDLQRPFMESRKQCEARLRRNAMMLALAQSIESDELTTDEAQRSIGALTTGEMNWLKDLVGLATACAAFRAGSTSYLPGEDAQLGDIAVCTRKEGADLRLVAGWNDRNVSLVRLDRKNHRTTFTPKSLGIVRFPTV